MPSDSAEKASECRVVCISHSDTGEQLVAVCVVAGYLAEQVASAEAAMHEIMYHPRAVDVLVIEHAEPVDAHLLLIDLRSINYQGKIVIVADNLSASDVAQFKELAVDAILATHEAADSILPIIGGFRSW